MARKGLNSPGPIATGLAQGLHPSIGQGIGPFVARVACMAFYPAPVDLVAARADNGIQPLPQFYIFYRLFGCRFPASGLPAMNPLRDALQHVFAI